MEYLLNGPSAVWRDWIKIKTAAITTVDRRFLVSLSDTFKRHSYLNPELERNTLFGSDLRGLEASYPTPHAGSGLSS